MANTQEIYSHSWQKAPVTPGGHSHLKGATQLPPFWQPGWQKAVGEKKGGRFNNSSGDLELSTEESQMTWKRTRIKEEKHIVICARTTYVVFSTLAFLFWNLCKLNCSVYNLFLKYIVTVAVYKIWVSRNPIRQYFGLYFDRTRSNQK